jgi:hypothetical protein
VLESDAAQLLAIGLIVVSILGTAITVVRIWRRS